MAIAQLQAVLFDLDDTLFDHLYSARHGLISLANRYESMQSVSVRELEDRYSKALESVHLRLLRGEVTQSEARTRRMQQLFRSFDIHVDDETALLEYVQFRRDYDSVCQAVAGSRKLLTTLRQQGLRLALVTNNLVSAQMPKLRQLSFEQYFDVVSISEEVGSAKPEARIFEVTLERLSLSSDEVVMVGDSLQSDVAGAVAAGIRAVWLDRRPDQNRHAPLSVDVIHNDFANLHEAIDKIC